MPLTRITSKGIADNAVTEDKITKCEINFFSPINEQYLASFANKVEQILKSMVTGKHAPVSVKGNKQQLKSFAKALGDEKKYILALSDTNVANPETMSIRHDLENSIANFEKNTGIKWPVR